MFVFCCAVPTALTLFCVLVTWTPWYHQGVLSSLEQHLSTELGLIVEIGQLHRDSPTQWQLENVRLIQAETREEVMRIRRLQWNEDAQQTSLLLHQPELRAAELTATWKLIHDRFLCRPDRTVRPMLFAANDLTIHSQAGSLTLRDLDAAIRPRKEAVEAQLQCVPAHQSLDAPIEIVVRRERGEKEPATVWLLDTGGTTLPCTALADYIPLLRRLGSEATFRGTLAAKLGQHHSSIDLSGSRFEDVSMDRLFEGHSHRLSGNATVQFERCRIDPAERRSDIAGSMRIHDGLIGRSLLAAAADHLGFQIQLPETMNEIPGDVPFDRLALGFNINNTQMTLRGICRTERGYESYPADVVLLLDGLPLVKSSEQTLASLQLMTAIAPPHSVPVPMSAQTSGQMHI